MSSEKIKAVLDGVKKALKERKGSDEELPDLPEGSPDVAADMEKLKNLVNSFTQKLGNAGGSATPGIQIHWAVYVVIIVVFVSTIGLFGYRLVQSLQEKERKREEKRKLKEAKKKK
ncbi:unnamed protein product [Allacma fusca]|uniref:Uncharacterized protein n=1 Tax=Allacma fusca TaxID=39272 RepID=A0A8J2KMX4_9HEXA|nr:unnamed protein product [Allacma fusca]